jgi:glycosyltransferase involved in cell wall biosynthesis
MKNHTDKPLLTIGIPTYNRSDDLYHLLKKITDHKIFLKNSQILVIDDGSTDSTKEIFEKENLESSAPLNTIKFLRNEKNIGYPKNFIRLFQECETDYLLVLADDNVIFEDGFLNAIQVIKSRKPSFLSSPWIQGGKIAHRTWKRGASDGMITISDFFRSADHAPGLIYDCNKAKKYLNEIEKRIASNCSFTSVFPQVNLSLNLFLNEGGCYYTSTPLGAEGSAHPSGIKDALGQSWRTYSSLLRQAADLDEYIATIPTTIDKKIIQISAQKYYMNYFFKVVDPAIERHFQIFLSNQLLFIKPMRIIKSALKKAFRFFTKKSN